MIPEASNRALPAACLHFFLLVMMAWGQSGFMVDATLLDEPGEAPVVRISMTQAPHHYLYADQFQVMGLGQTELEALTEPPVVEKHDPFMGMRMGVITQSFETHHAVRAAPGGLVELSVHWQGCDSQVCFMPEHTTFRLPLEERPETGLPRHAAMETATAGETLPDAHSWLEAAAAFEVTTTATGFMNAEAFTQFLTEAHDGDSGRSATLAERHVWLAMLLILLGGLALNLTPCILPMLPVNLAIIGAGSQAASRARGFRLGSAYGGGIALAYGLLGGLVVATGTTFGTLNASPWFNGGITILFVLLALAMFDVIHIDLTRFQPTGGQRSGHAGMGMAFGLGVISALLAGACVAPVVIAVLIWAGDLYGQGLRGGLLLPLVLGLGMALPWPLAGAGLACLPRPGRWMIAVRNGLGVLILLLAAYYGKLAYQLAGFSRQPGRAITAEAFDPETENQHLAAALEQALEDERPVLLFFTASWCRSCQTMKATTLRQRNVLAALESYDLVMYQAEQPTAAPVRAVLEHYGVLGLPTFLILRPTA